MPAAVVVDAKAMSSSGRKNTATAAGAAGAAGARRRGLGLIIFGGCRGKRYVVATATIKYRSRQASQPHRVVVLWRSVPINHQHQTRLQSQANQDLFATIRFDSTTVTITGVAGFVLAAFPVLSREERRAAPPIDAELEATK